jgi:hypothetical protein
MALKLSNQVHTQTGDTNLSLTPRSGEALMVRDVKIYNPATNYVTLKISATVVGYFRVGGTLGNHLPFPLQDEENSGIIALLQSIGLMEPYPVAQGETFTIEGAKQAGAVQAVYYDTYDASDVRPDMPNGSKANRRVFISYGKPSSAPVDGLNTYDTMVNPAEFPSFPWETVVPQNRTITFNGVLFSDVGERTSSAASNQITEFTQFIHNQTFLFDMDLVGVPYIGIVPSSDTFEVGTGSSRGGNFSDVDQRLPWMFDTPIVCRPGDELQIKVETSVGAGSAMLDAVDVEMGLITTVETS